MDLQRLYQEVNHDSFAGSLPNVPVRWSDLTKDDAYGVTHFDKGVPYSIEVDRQSVKTESFALDVLRHESCHIATIGEAKRRNEDCDDYCASARGAGVRGVWIESVSAFFAGNIATWIGRTVFVDFV